MIVDRRKELPGQRLGFESPLRGNPVTNKQKAEKLLNSPSWHIAISDHIWVVRYKECMRNLSKQMLLGRVTKKIINSCKNFLPNKPTKYHGHRAVMLDKNSSSYPVKRDRTLDWLFSREKEFKFQPGYPLSRLYPFYSDMEMFKQTFDNHLFDYTWKQKIQLFIDWLTDREKGQYFSACYYIALNGTGVPKTPKKYVEKSTDMLRFISK